MLLGHITACPSCPRSAFPQENSRTVGQIKIKAAFSRSRVPLGRLCRAAASLYCAPKRGGGGRGRRGCWEGGKRPCGNQADGVSPGRGAQAWTWPRPRAPFTGSSQTSSRHWHQPCGLSGAPQKGGQEDSAQFRPGWAQTSPRGTRSSRQLRSHIPPALMAPGSPLPT